MKALSLCLAGGLLLLAPAVAGAVVLGQADTFEDGTVMGWSEGTPSPNMPTNVADDGPAGAGDNYLENVAAGSSGAGSKMVMFNTDQWQGDYLTAGVDRIDAMMRASSNGQSLAMRIALRGPTADWWVSSVAVPLPNDNLWHAVSFDLNTAAMTLVAGGAELDTVLSNVTELRILSSSTLDYRGEAVNNALGVDNITSLPEPGALLLLAAGWPLISRRRNRR